MNNGIDASIDLHLTLQILQQYRESGTLQANIPHMPKVGPCTALIILSAGNVVGCTIQDRKNQTKPIGLSTLIRLDKDKGPFEWRFHPQGQEQSPISSAVIPYPPPPQYSPQPYYPSSAAIPRIIARLNLDWLTTWPHQQKRALHMVYAMVNGQRTVKDIERALPLPARIIQEALVILIAMKVVVIDER